MSDAIRFHVSGQPVPKQSFRARTSRGKVVGYRDPRVTAWQEAVAWEGRQAMQGAEPLVGKLYVQLDFILPNHRRVDLDNLSKAILDSLNGVCWLDDMQVVELSLSKRIERAYPGVGVLVQARV